MKKTAFVLGYAGSILALVFSMLMIITVPLRLADDLLNDMTDELKPEHILALNDTAIKMGEVGWTDYSENGLLEIAKKAASDSTVAGDMDVYEDAVKFAHKAGLNVMISLIVVAAAIVLALLSLIGALIVKKAPTAGGVLLLLTGFFLLLAAIYTGTLWPTFTASVLLALGGIAVFIPERMKRTAIPAPAHGVQRSLPPQNGYAPQYVPQQNGYAPQVAPQAVPTAPQYAPQQIGYAPQYAPQAAPVPQTAPTAPQYAPQQNGYAPQIVPQAVPAPPVEPQYVPQAAPAPQYVPQAPPAAQAYVPPQAPAEEPVQAAPAPGSGLPFPEEVVKPGDDEE